VDQKRRSCKAAEFIYQVFKVALFTYRVWIKKEGAVKFWSLYIKVFNVVLAMYRGRISKDESVKLLSLYIKYFKLRCLCIECGSEKWRL